MACEPALSGHAVSKLHLQLPLPLTLRQYANDFLHMHTNITSGLMLLLTRANLLMHAIVVSTQENLDMEHLIYEVRQVLSQCILGGNKSIGDIAKELHERLLLRNESTSVS